MFQLSMNKSTYCVTEDMKVLKQTCSSPRMPAAKGDTSAPPSALPSWQHHRQARKSVFDTTSALSKAG